LERNFSSFGLLHEVQICCGGKLHSIVVREVELCCEQLIDTPHWQCNVLATQLLIKILLSADYITADQWSLPREASGLPHIVTVFLTRLCVCVQFSEYELSKKVTCLTSLTINNSKWCLWVLALWIAGFFIMLHKITYMWLIYEYLWHRLLACALTMCRLYVDLRSRYAFVKFYSSHAAARALEIMKGQLYIGGQCLKVLHCVIV